MPAPEIESAPEFLRRIPLARIDALVSTHLGPARVEHKEQPAVFNRQIAMYLAKRVGGWSTTAIGRFYHGRDHSTVCYSIQRIKTLREINREVDQLVTKLEKALQDPESSLAGCPSVQLLTSIRLDKVSEEILLDKLADGIASRLIRVLGGVHVSGRPFRAGADLVAQTDHSPDTAN